MGCNSFVFLSSTVVDDVKLSHIYLQIKRSQFDIDSFIPAELPEILIFQFLHDFVENVDFAALRSFESKRRFLPSFRVGVSRRQQ